MDIKYKVWLEKDGEVVVGNGKVGLLKIVSDLGSIQKAAEKMGMSYRHAWGMIQKIEKRSGFKLVETQVGGKEGGGAQLTLQGKELLNQYSAFRKGLDEAVESKFRRYFKN
jgi:molybdate transport system regulatory protein